MRAKPDSPNLNMFREAMASSAAFEIWVRSSSATLLSSSRVIIFLTIFANSPSPATWGKKRRKNNIDYRVTINSH